MTAAAPLSKSIDRVAGAVRQQRYKMQLDRMVRRTSGNEDVALRDFLLPQCDRLAARLGLVPQWVKQQRARWFEDDLRLLNDALAGTGFGAHYWVWGGMLLGWAREGRLIASDIGEADFGYTPEHEDLFAQAEPALLDAGFRRWYAFWSNSGVRTNTVYIRRGSLYEFSLMTPLDADRLEYHAYGVIATGVVQQVAHVPHTGVEEFQFLGRTWRKPVDHEKLFELNYGDWRTPDPQWNYLDDGAAVRRETWQPVGAPM